MNMNTINTQTIFIFILIVILFIINIKYHSLLERFSSLSNIFINNNTLSLIDENKSKKIAIVIIATNSYFLLGLRFIKQWFHFYNSNIDCKFYFCSDTDVLEYIPTNFHNKIKWINTTHTSWEDATNSKFTNIIELKDTFEEDNCEHVFYFDADTSINKEFDHTWFLKGNLVGGEHYNNSYDSDKPFERNPKSKAYVPKNTDLEQIYYYGAFFGGKILNVITFCKEMLTYQKEDKLINIEPVWNDESYINKYFHYNKPSIVLNKDFKFIISDKNGMIGDFKNTNNNWNKKYLKTLQKDKKCIFFNFKNNTYECKYEMISPNYTSNISVCIPCYPPHKKILETCIASISKQTVLPDEIIIAISETTNNEANNMLDTYNKLYPNLNIQISNIVEKGNQAVNRNRGMKIASKEYISFIDADDTMYKERIHILIKTIEMYKPTCILHTFTRDENLFNNNLLGDYKIKFSKELLKQANETKEDGRHINAEIHHGHVTIHKKIIKNITYKGVGNNKLPSEDSIFVREIINKYATDSPTSIVYIDIPITYYKQ